MKKTLRFAGRLAAQCPAARSKNLMAEGDLRALHGNAAGAGRKWQAALTAAQALHLRHDEVEASRRLGLSDPAMSDNCHDLMAQMALPVARIWDLGGL